MFTGLIEAVGLLQALENQGGERLLRIRSELDLSGVALGDSIAVNGVCLTVTAKGEQVFAAQVSAETLQRTTLAHLKPGATVNLERALAYGGRLNGHLVQGHVDGVGRVERLLPRGGSVEVWFALPRAMGRYLVAKGSIAIDGVSLTVNAVVDAEDVSRFSVNLIPHTQQKTTLAQLAIHRLVNIETDLLGRYVERLLGPAGKRCLPAGGLDEAYLRERGF
ncbi:MAG: riboflavin synthase [Magnetococcales bacterium]|nr:riboflavin synthase [Magnetococcales bacterium]